MGGFEGSLGWGWLYGKRTYARHGWGAGLWMRSRLANFSKGHGFSRAESHGVKFAFRRWAGLEEEPRSRGNPRVAGRDVP
jgi:hypothetical protein